MFAQQVAGRDQAPQGGPLPGDSRAEGSRSRRDRPTRPLRHHSPANQYRHDNQPLPARIADRVTAMFGLWGFILTQSFLIVLWIGYNAFAAVHFLHSSEFDPFILLNLLFSTQAAYAAPLILLSQNRTAERDRIKAEHDFDVDVLALRALARLLGDVPDTSAEKDLIHRIHELLGSTPEPAPHTRSDI